MEENKIFKFYLCVQEHIPQIAWRLLETHLEMAFPASPLGHRQGPCDASEKIYHHGFLSSIQNVVCESCQKCAQVRKMPKIDQLDGDCVCIFIYTSPRVSVNWMTVKFGSILVCGVRECEQLGLNIEGLRWVHPQAWLLFVPICPGHSRKLAIDIYLFYSCLKFYAYFTCSSLHAFSGC